MTSNTVSNITKSVAKNILTALQNSQTNINNQQKIYGKCDTKTIQPGWKLFRVDRMNGLRKLGGNFYEPRKLFNPNGDKDMIEIYNIIKFE